MITVKKLRELLATLPDDATCVAYEGEDRGIIVTGRGDRTWWIRARSGDDEDDQAGFARQVVK